MQLKSLGLIETKGLAIGIEAADAAVKSANVELIGYELSKGGGWTTIKLQGEIGAVKAAVDAARSVALKTDSVVSTKVIARPSDSLATLVHTPETVGNGQPVPTDIPTIQATPEAPVESVLTESVEQQIPSETSDMSPAPEAAQGKPVEVAQLVNEEPKEAENQPPPHASTDTDQKKSSESDTSQKTEGPKRGKNRDRNK